MSKIVNGEEKQTRSFFSVVNKRGDHQDGRGRLDVFGLKCFGGKKPGGGNHQKNGHGDGIELPGGKKKAESEDHQGQHGAEPLDHHHQHPLQ